MWIPPSIPMPSDKVLHLNNQACAWLDFRPAEAFALGHFSHAAQFDWPDVTQRLNELPAPSAKLGLIAPKDIWVEIQDFLTSKGYHVNELIDANHFDYTQPGLVAGPQSACLWSANSFLVEAIDLMALSPNSEVLDLGCGGGRDAVYLALHGYHVTAIDQETRVLARAQQLAQANQISVDWRQCDLRQPDCFPKQPFDLMLMLRFLNRHLYARMRQQTRPGGYVLIQTFVEGVEVFGSPKNPNFILRKGELAKEFAEFEPIIDRIDTLNDGRPVASFLARRRGE